MDHTTSTVTLNKERIPEKNDGKVNTISKSCLIPSPFMSNPTLLHYFTECDDERAIKYILNSGYSVDTQDSNGTTALMIAVRKQHRKATEILLANKAKLTKLNNEGKNALHIFFEEHIFSLGMAEIIFPKVWEQFSNCQEIAKTFKNAGSRLYQAVYFGNSLVIKYMLKDRVPVFETHYTSKQTALHIAVLTENVNIVKLLTKNIDTKHKNLFINAQDINGTTALMLAVRRQHLKIIKTLLAAEGDITILNEDGKSALHMFCEENIFSPEMGKLIFPELRKRFTTYQEIAETLITAGSCLYQAVYLGDTKVIEYMLERNFSVNSTEPLFTKKSGLHIAVENEDVDMVQLLISHDANTIARDAYGMIPLNYIYRRKFEHTREKIKLLKILLNSNVSPTSCNSLGLFHISTTLIKGNSEAIRTVLQSNINFTAQDNKNERNLLHYLAVNFNSGVVAELKPYINRFNINLVDKAGINALHMASAYANSDMVQFLLSQNSSPNCTRFEYGLTPLYYAYAKFKPKRKDQCDQCVNLLLQHNADPQAIFTNDSGRQITIFDVAKETNSLKKTRSIVAHLAVLEGLGLSIIEKVSTEISSHSFLRKYFHRCQKMIKKRISGSVTLFKLLTSGKQKLARYSANRELMLKLKRLDYKQNLKNSYLHYHSTLRTQFPSAIRYKRLMDKAAEVLCEILENRFEKGHLVISKIIDYLDEESFEQLSKVNP